MVKLALSLHIKILVAASKAAFASFAYAKALHSQEKTNATNPEIACKVERQN